MPEYSAPKQTTQRQQSDCRKQTYEGPVERLDKGLVKLWPDVSRARWQALIKDGHIHINGTPTLNPKTKLHPGNTVDAELPAPIPATPQPENIPLEILYEDKDLVVINKAAGMVVHPAAGNHSGTLVNALLHHCAGSLSGIGGEARPGIVHRLDKDTSGVMVVAKNDAAHHGLSEQFADHSIEQRYRALVWGHPIPANGTVTGNIGRHPNNRQKMAVIERGGKHATTHYTTLQTFTPTSLDPVTLIECQLETGRTHQIRVHMTKIGHPLLGDPVYTSRKSAQLNQKLTFGQSSDTFSRQALHAATLGFTHPTTGENLFLSSDLPNDFKDLIDFLEEC